VATDLQWYGGGLGLHRHAPTKVFSIGGGSLAWIDLRHGIMMCNVLDEEPELRLIQLPQLLPSNQGFFGERLDGCRPPLDPIRDVSFRDGRFSFIEIEYPYETDDSDTTEPLDFRWRATVFKTSISSGQWEWDRCHTVLSSRVRTHVSFSCFLRSGSVRGSVGRRDGLQQGRHKLTPYTGHVSR
jgi:hypothetical protein